jgi:hypothetical protein
MPDLLFRQLRGAEDHRFMVENFTKKRRRRLEDRASFLQILEQLASPVVHNRDPIYIQAHGVRGVLSPALPAALSKQVNPRSTEPPFYPQALRTAFLDFSDPQHFCRPQSNL